MRNHVAKRLCTTCKIKKPEEDFHRKSKFKFTGRCFECNAKRSYDNYHYSERAKVNREKRKALRLEIINKAKSVPCLDCKQTFPIECMDFDHINGDKEYTIANMKDFKIEALKKEIAKCEVVCANCHRIRTKQRDYIENKERFRHH